MALGAVFFSFIFANLSPDILFIYAPAKAAHSRDEAMKEKKHVSFYHFTFHLVKSNKIAEMRGEIKRSFG